MGSHKGGVNSLVEEAGSFPAVTKAVGFRAFINDDGGASFKSFCRKPSSKGSFLKRPRSGCGEEEEVDVEDCGSLKGKEGPSVPSSREGGFPNVHRFDLNVLPIAREICSFRTLSPR